VISVIRDQLSAGSELGEGGGRLLRDAQQGVGSR
jgi:hypothetical protein